MPIVRKMIVFASQRPKRTRIARHIERIQKKYFNGEKTILWRKIMLWKKNIFIYK